MTIRTQPVVLIDSEDYLMTGEAGTEAEFIIAFALKWAPFGGPPSDEVYVNFGTTHNKFVDMLRRTLQSAACPASVRESITSAYHSLRLDP